MTRTKGAKNKPKSDETLLAELKARGYNITKESESENDETTNTETVKKAFDLKPPIFPEPGNEEPAESDGKTILRCGNPACKKILTSEVETCPYCGAGLKWQ